MMPTTMHAILCLLSILCVRADDDEAATAARLERACHEAGKVGTGMGRTGKARQGADGCGSGFLADGAPHLHPPVLNSYPHPLSRVLGIWAPLPLPAGGTLPKSSNLIKKYMETAEFGFGRAN